MLAGTIRLGDLEPGALFEITGGEIALKTEYHTFDDGRQCDCYLLRTGEAAHLVAGDEAMVKPIRVGSPLEAILAERVYQDRKWGSVHEHPHEIAGWLTIARLLLRKAEDAWAHNAGWEGDAMALTEVRKIAAVCVACMEQHGVIERDR